MSTPIGSRTIGKEKEMVTTSLEAATVKILYEGKKQGVNKCLLGEETTKTEAPSGSH
jgi:hypothetical protein